MLLGLARPAGMLVGFLAFLAIGCQKAPGIVAGKVTVNKKPLPKGLITFLPDSGNSFNAAILNGEYETSEIPAGPAKVVIMPALEPPPPGPKAGDLTPPPKRSVKKGIEVDERYQNARTSGLELTVKSGRNEYDVDLVP